MTSQSVPPLKGTTTVWNNDQRHYSKLQFGTCTVALSVHVDSYALTITMLVWVFPRKGWFKITAKPCEQRSSLVAKVTAIREAHFGWQGAEDPVITDAVIVQYSLLAVLLPVS